MFTFAGGSGHADPLIPVAIAARSAGHEVAFSGRHSAADSVIANGFVVLGDSDEGSGDPAEIAPLRPLDMRHEERVLRDYYAGRLARARFDSIHEVCAHWKPDLIVCDEVDFGSMITAEQLGIPHVTVVVTAAGSFVRAEVVADSLDAIRTERSLPPDPELAMPARHLVLCPFPRSFRDPAYPLPPTAMPVRAITARLPPAGLPTRHAARPIVYATLGTVFNLESGDLFDRIIEGLGSLPIEAIVTIGRELDPARFVAPANVRIEGHLPHADMLPLVDAVVSHGGSGTVLGTLANGLPQVVIPMGADQLLNAGRCEALDLGIALDAIAATPDEIARAVRTVLDDPRYGGAADLMREEIASHPEPRAAVRQLEGLV